MRILVFSEQQERSKYVSAWGGGAALRFEFRSSSGCSVGVWLEGEPNECGPEILKRSPGEGIKLVAIETEGG